MLSLHVNTHQGLVALGVVYFTFFLLRNDNLSNFLIAVMFGSDFVQCRLLVYLTMETGITILQFFVVVCIFVNKRLFIYLFIYLFIADSFRIGQYIASWKSVVKDS